MIFDNKTIGVASGRAAGRCKTFSKRHRADRAGAGDSHQAVSDVPHGHAGADAPVPVAPQEI